eukprot:GHVL01038768.1.p1 GENE.GHVL01038768.1~~GHVL01038768.1.p1  ORF type:complete len:840 (+),score=131.69 GHVL01038768.1:18-2537(+)
MSDWWTSYDESFQKFLQDDERGEEDITQPDVLSAIAAALNAECENLKNDERNLARDIRIAQRALSAVDEELETTYDVQSELSEGTSDDDEDPLKKSCVSTLDEYFVPVSSSELTIRVIFKRLDSPSQEATFTFPIDLKYFIDCRKNNLDEDNSFKNPTIRDMSDTVCGYWSLDPLDVAFLDTQKRLLLREQKLISICIVSYYCVLQRPYTLTMVLNGYEVANWKIYEKVSNTDSFGHLQKKAEKSLAEIERGRANSIDGQEYLPIPKTLEEYIHASEKKIRHEKMLGRWRMFEGFVFLLAVLSYLVLPLPENYTTAHRRATREAVVQDLKRQFDNGITFDDIQSYDEFAGWLGGPFWDSIERGGYFEKRNLFVLGASRIRRINIISFESLQSSLQITDLDRVYCGDRGKDMMEAIGISIPCTPSYNKYRMSIIGPLRDQLRSIGIDLDEEKTKLPSFTGQLGTYKFGQELTLPNQDMDAAAEFVRLVSATWNSLDLRAVLVSMVVIDPSSEVIVVVYAIFEVNQTGSLIATMRVEPVQLQNLDASSSIALFFTVLSSACILVFEFRRIYIVPKSERSKFSVWTIIHILLPIAIILVGALRLIIDSKPFLEALDLLTFSEASVDFLIVINDLVLISETVALLLFCFLIPRYTLYKISNRQRGDRPANHLLMGYHLTFLMTVTVLGIATIFFFTQFHHRSYDFRNTPRSLISLVKILLGSYKEMIRLYNDWSGAFVLEYGCMYILMFFILRPVQIGIVLSALWEFQLRQNAAYHPLWKDRQAFLESSSVERGETIDMDVASFLNPSNPFKKSKRKLREEWIYSRLDIQEKIKKARNCDFNE